MVDVLMLFVFVLGMGTDIFCALVNVNQMLKRGYVLVLILTLRGMGGSGLEILKLVKAIHSQWRHLSVELT